GHIFLRGKDGRRPVAGALENFQSDPYWRDLILFHEYFHGDNGAGIGANRQTGWTGLVAKLLEQSGEWTPGMAAQRKSRNEATRPAKRSSPAKKPREEKMMSDVTISFGPAICNDLTAAEQREWLVTNGIGGFASGTVAGSATRRYHGLLIAAVNP